MRYLARNLLAFLLLVGFGISYATADTLLTRSSANMVQTVIGTGIIVPDIRVGTPAYIDTGASNLSLPQSILNILVAKNRAIRLKDDTTRIADGRIIIVKMYQVNSIELLNDKGQLCSLRGPFIVHAGDIALLGNEVLAKLSPIIFTYAGTHITVDVTCPTDWIDIK